MFHFSANQDFVIVMEEYIPELFEKSKFFSRHNDFNRYKTLRSKILIQLYILEIVI